MIDPSIALSVKPVQVASPLEEYGQLLSLKHMAQQGQLAQQQLQTAQLENQQRQNALANDKAVNDALAQNTVIGPNGAPSINHDGVIQTLTKAGHGQQAIAYQTTLAKQQAEQAAALKTQLDNGLTKAQMGTSLLQGVTDQNGLDHARQAFQAWGLDAGKLPTVYDKDAIESAINSGLKAKDYLQKQKNAVDAQFKKQELDISQQNADANQQRADAEDTRNQQTADYNKATTEYRNKNLSERTRHDKADEAASNAAGSGPDTLTANAAAVQRRADQRELTNLTEEENNLHTTREQLGSAIASKKAFVDKNGKTVKISDDADEAEQQIADMQARFEGATRRVQQVIGRKNELIQSQGGTPKVSTAEANAAVQQGGTASKPASPQAGKPAAIAEGTIVKNKDGVRKKLVNGQWQTLSK